MKKIIIAVVVAIVAYGVYKWITSSPNINPPITTTFPTSCELYDVKEVKPDFVNAYIDASGSMKGYFSIDADGRFITALSNANPDKTMWMDGNFTELNGVPTNQLLTNRYSGGDSFFDKMLSTITKHDSLWKSKGVSLLFTDGILSASPNDTRQNPEYMRQSFGAFKNAIAKSIDSKMAVAIYQLEGKYSGAYWDYRNKKVPGVVVEDRPFYVIALGEPAQVRHFIANNKLGAKLYTAYGIYKTKSDPKSEYKFQPVTPVNWDNTTLKNGKKVEFRLMLPDYIVKLGNDCVKKNLVIEYDQKDVTSQLIGCVSQNGADFRILNWAQDDMAKPILTPGSHELTIKIKKHKQDEWDKLYCEDDTAIKTNDTQQKQTFALKYLLQGIQEGTQEADNAIIFSSTIKFNI